MKANLPPPPKKKKLILLYLIVMEKSFFLLASDMMSFMVCMKQALQNRNSLSHEFSNDSTGVSLLTFVDWSVSLRLIGAWNENAFNSNHTFHSSLVSFSFTKAKATAKQPGRRKVVVVVVVRLKNRIFRCAFSKQASSCFPEVAV
jgi:hypothetical protein